MHSAVAIQREPRRATVLAADTAAATAVAADMPAATPIQFMHRNLLDSVVAHAGPKTIRSFQPMMWKRFEAQSDFIYFRFDPSTESRWQFEENGIEALVVNLSRRPHEPFGSRTRAASPAAMSHSDR